MVLDDESQIGKDFAYNLSFYALISLMKGAVFSFNRGFQTDDFHNVMVVSFFEPYSLKQIEGVFAPGHELVQSGLKVDIPEDKKLVIEVIISPAFTCSAS